MKTFHFATIVTACMLWAPVWAQQDLAQKKNCLACHAVNQKVIGPSYKEVATKYAGQPDALAKLVPEGDEGRLGRLGRGADARQPASQRGRSQATRAMDPVPQVGIAGHHLGRYCEALAVAGSASAAALARNLARPSEADELDRAAGPRRKADAEDRADVCFGSARQHAFGEAARGLDRLAVEQSALQFFHVGGDVGLREMRRQAGPEALRLRPRDSRRNRRRRHGRAGRSSLTIRSTSSSPADGTCSLALRPSASARVCSSTCTESASDVSSSTASGPTGIPAASAACSISGAATPSASIAAPSMT